MPVSHPFAVPTDSRDLQANATYLRIKRKVIVSLGAEPIDINQWLSPDFQGRSKSTERLQGVQPPNVYPSFAIQPKLFTPAAYSQEEVEFLAQYEEDWPDITKGEGLKRRADHVQFMCHSFNSFMQLLLTTEIKTEPVEMKYSPEEQQFLIQYEADWSDITQGEELKRRAKYEKCIFDIGNEFRRILGISEMKISPTISANDKVLLIQYEEDWPYVSRGEELKRNAEYTRLAWDIISNIQESLSDANLKPIPFTAPSANYFGNGESRGQILTKNNSQNIPPKKSYYEILQITQTADTETIRAAYYGFMKQFYPEGSRRDPNDEFHRLLTHAYEVLTDSARRAGYDAALLYATRTEV
jgi:hypothetical protein